MSARMNARVSARESARMSARVSARVSARADKTEQRELDKKLKQIDHRVSFRRFSWLEYIMLFIVIQIITSGQILIVFSMMGLGDLPAPIIAGAFGYAALMALVACGLARLTRSYFYDRPLRMLGFAAHDIAQGNFSVYLPQVRKSKHKDQMAVLFEDFNTMAKELSSIETLKDDFIGNVSHELKTPLATIKNYATELSKDDLPEAQRQEYTETLIQTSDRLSVLVSNILKLNRLENQVIVPDSREYDLSEQLRVCILSFEDTINEKEIEIEADIDDAVVIDLDQELLDLIWRNLLSNAIKFTDPGGKVAIRLHPEPGMLSVEIADTGCGMTEDAQKHIFDKFYQADTSHAQEGNGLGLALALRACELAGCSISLKSKLNEGTTFTVQL